MKKKNSIFYDIYNQPYDWNSRFKLYSSCKASLQLVQRMSLMKRLKVHNGCVNSICWNSTGELILSGSDDQHLVLTNVYNYKVLTDFKTSHRANIFSAKFLPDNGDHRIVSCSGDGIILYSDLTRTAETFHNQFTCHNGTAYEVSTVPGEPHSFLSCGEDCTVRYFDLRVKTTCNVQRCKEDVLILSQKAVTAMSVNPTMPHYLAIGCSDSTVGIYDRRMLSIGDRVWSDDGISWTSPVSMFTVPEFEGHPYRITSLSYSPDGNDVLVSYSSDHIYLFSTKDQKRVNFKKNISTGKSKNKRPPVKSSQPVRRLRLRGDWSDTGPNARPEREGEIAQDRPVLHTSLMQRMTDVLSRMLNDPATRAALSGGGEDNFRGVIDEHAVEAADSNNDIEEDRSSDAQSMDVESNAQSIENNPENDSMEAVVIVENNLETENSESQNSFEGENNSNRVNNDNTPLEIINDEIVSLNDNENLPNQSNNIPVDSSFDKTCKDTKDDKDAEDNVNRNDTSNIENHRDESMMENLQDRLTSMRDGFLEKHGSEPAVSLTYSDKSSTGATISLGVANEVIRDSYHPGPSGSQSKKSESSSHKSNCDSKICYEKSCEQIDEEVYSDSDDELDVSPRRKVVNDIETEMDEAVANARAASLGQSEPSSANNSFSEYIVKQKYTGHRNARTMIKEANFWGNNFIMSGSDCGHVFIWDKETAKLCMLLEADQHVVNCVQPHPYLPMFATSGIDYDVKLWAPINEEPNFDITFAEDLQKRNAVMLEETKDTITVPAVFMIRMLACLNQIRRGRGRNRRRSGDESDDLRGGN